jgi:hypothetical protein
MGLMLLGTGYVQNHCADSDGGFADGAFTLAAVLEGCAVAVVVANVLFFGAFFDARRVPHGDGDEGGEPEDCVQGVDGEEGICVGETLGSTPHGDHYEVNDCRETEEGLGGDMLAC